MKFGKKTIALIGAVAMLSSVAACGSTSAGDSGSTGSSDKKIELTVWSWDSTLPRTVKGFEAKNPNIKVKVTNAGTNKDEYNALSNAIEAGSGAPDIAQIEYYALPEYVIRGHLENLSDLGASDFKDFYTPGTWSSVNINDASTPCRWIPARWPGSTTRASSTRPASIRPGAHVGRLLRAAKKIRAVDSYITSDSGDAGFFDSMTWLAGATPFETSKDGGTVTINLTGDKNVKTFTDFWQKMIDEDLIDTKTVGWTDDWNKGLDDGSIASLLTGAWMPYNLLSGAPNGDGKWRIAQMPTADGSETSSENGGSSLAIVKSDDKDKVAAAYKFMEYACHDAEGIKTRVDGGAFPADNDTLKSDDFLNMTSLTDSDGKAHEYFGGQKFNEELAKAAANVSTGYKFLPFEVYARGKFGDYAGDAYTGKTTLSDAVASWQKDLQDYAKQQGYQVK